MVRLTPPEVAVTLSVNVPAGVPIVPPPPPPIGDPPLPQEAHSAANSSVAASTGHVLCGISLPAQAVLRRNASAKATVIANPNNHGSQGIPDCGPAGGMSREGAPPGTQ